MSNKLKELMNSTLEQMKSVVNADSIIGNPITTENGTVIIPVSKLSYGFASGGSDFSGKKSDDMFGGGNGAGVNIVPVAFLVIAGEDVKLLEIESFNSTTLDRVISMTPDIIDKISKFIKKEKKDKKENPQKN